MPRFLDRFRIVREKQRRHFFVRRDRDDSVCGSEFGIKFRINISNVMMIAKGEQRPQFELKCKICDLSAIISILESLV